MQCCLLKAKLSFCLEPTLLQDSAQAAWCISPKQQLIDGDPSGCPGVPLKIHDNTMTFVLWTEAQWPGLDLLFKGTDWNLRRSQRKLALQRKASKWNLMHWESFSKLSKQKVRGVVCFFPPIMHCSCYRTADHLSVHCTLPLIEYLTSKQLRAITDQRMDSCLWTKAAASLRTTACQSNCRVWTTAWCLWFSNCFSCPPVVSSILSNMPPNHAHLSSRLIWLGSHRTAT